LTYLYYHCTKKKGECCQKGYTREEILEVQFREMIKSLSVSETWVTQMNSFLVQDVECQKVEDKNTSLSLETEISQTEQKLDTLLEAYLDTVIDSESYSKKKNELMERKANLISKQKELLSDNPNWIEAVTNYITCAQKCAKIARAENNCHDLADMAKKVGSKYFLKDKKIEFCLYFPYNLLAANGGAASFPAQFVPTLAFGQSKYYVDSLSENTKRGLRQKVRQGEYPGLAPVGYLNDIRTKTIVVNKKRSKIIQQAFEIYAKGNSTLGNIADFLACNGIKTRGDKPFKRDKISFILSNPFYYGYFRYSGELHEGKHEPIIAKKLFDNVQEVLKQRGRPRKEKVPKAFCGLLRCGECGMMITGEQKTKYYKGTNRTVTYTYYRCTKKSKTHECNQKFIRQEELDSQLSSMIQKVSLRQDWVEWMLNKLKQEEIQSAQSCFTFVQENREKIKNLKLKLQFLLDSYLDQIIEREIYLEKKSEIIGKIKTLEEQNIRFEQKQNDWLGPMRDWINEAANAAKIARDTNLFAKKELLLQIYGSDLYLRDKKTKGEAKFPYAALAAKGGAASAANQCLTVVLYYEKTRTQFRDSC